MVIRLIPPAREAISSEINHNHHHRFHKDSRCGKDDCGWIKDCRVTVIGKICWNVYCYCGDESDQVPELSSHEVLMSCLTRDDRCSLGECGWAETCDEAGPGLADKGPWQTLNCPCLSDELISLKELGKSEEQDVVVGNRADGSCYACQREECGWVERCKELGRTRLCWAMHCTHGCDDQAAKK